MLYSLNCYYYNCHCGKKKNKANYLVVTKRITYCIILRQMSYLANYMVAVSQQRIHGKAN